MLIKPLYRTASEFFIGKFCFMIALCQMTMYHNIIIFCKIHSCFQYLLCLILSNARSYSYTTHRVFWPIMIGIHQSLCITHNSINRINDFLWHNITHYRMIRTNRMETDSQLRRCFDFSIHQVMYSNRMRIPQIIRCGTTGFHTVAKACIYTSHSNFIP